MINKKQKINIIGYGYIGQATAIGLKRLGYSVAAYDIIFKDNIYNCEEFSEIPLTIGDKLPNFGIHVICIAEQILEDGSQEIKNVANLLKKLQGRGMIILRTTVLPKFLSQLHFDFFWPEFLHERAAIKEFLKPEINVVGRRDNKKFIFANNFSSIYYCQPEEVAHIKYLSNIWNALRIAFVNEFGDNLIKEGVEKKNVLDFFFKKKKYLKWGNAYGGNCLPKDTLVYLREYPHLLILKALIKSNNLHYDKYPDLESIY